MENSSLKSKRQPKMVKKQQRKVRDLVARKDPRGGENVTFNYGGVKYDYKP